MAKLHDLDIDDYLADCVRIEPLALEEEFVRTAADQAYWNERHARAARAFMAAKLQRERTNARLYMELRETLMLGAKQAADQAKADADAAAKAEVPAEDGKKKKAAASVKISIKGPTVSDIDSAVLNDPAMAVAREVEMDAEIEVERLKGVLNAVRTKRDMLIQLGANVRTEMQGDMNLRNQMQGQRRDRNDV